MKEVYNFCSFGKIIESFMKDFTKVLHDYDIIKINRDFKNIFFYYFLKSYNQILDLDSDVILVFDVNEKIEEISDHYSGFDNFLHKFHIKISKMFPLPIISGERLHGRYLLSDLKVESICSILETYKKNISIKKLRRDLSKKFIKLEKDLKLHKFFIFNK